jgi:hypothetical protein
MEHEESRTCAMCEGPISKDQRYCGDEATEYAGKPLCETCYYEDEPVATVFYGTDEEPRYISHTRNETEGDFRVTWHPTDPWRGYYEAQSDKYAQVLSDAILAYHESEAMLKDLNDRLIQLYDEHDLDFGRVFARTSNVFSTGLEFWVQRDPVALVTAQLLLGQAKRDVNYDDPLYWTGIVMGRDELQKLSALLGNRYELESDADLLRLVEQNGDRLLQELTEALHGPQSGESDGGKK